MEVAGGGSLGPAGQAFVKSSSDPLVFSAVLWPFSVGISHVMNHTLPAGYIGRRSLLFSDFYFPVPCFPPQYCFTSSPQPSIESDKS